MPDNRLLFPFDTDLVYVDDPVTHAPHPLRGKITQYWADALNSSNQTALSDDVSQNDVPVEY